MEMRGNIANCFEKAEKTSFGEFIQLPVLHDFRVSN